MSASSRSLRLLWVNQFAAARDMGGGTRHVELGRELQSLGWDVTIAASDFHLQRREYLRRAGALQRDPIREREDGVELVWVWTAPYRRNDWRRAQNWASFGNSVAALGSSVNPDLVIGSTPQLFGALASLRLARRLGVPFVLEVRDLWPESLAVGGRSRGPFYWLMWGVARHLYRNADAIVVLAPGVATYLAELGVPADRIVCVPNGVDMHAFGSAAPEERSHVRLVYAGAHGPANGLDVVLDAAERLRDEKDVSFLLIGDGPVRSALQADAARRGLQNVEFRDPVPKSDMPSLLATCDAGLMVLRPVKVFEFGVSPNKLFDYWGASLPVVCNVAGDVSSWVRTAEGGICTDAATADELVKAIRKLAAMSPEERRRMGARGRAWVAREHDRPVLAARLDAALRPLVASRT